MATMNRPYLSICIPTFRRLEILKKTLDSIYNNIETKLLSEFEVIVSDNDPNQSSKKIVDDYCFKNIFYYRSCYEGFFNSFNALKLGNGYCLKLHNNYSAFREGSLEKIIQEVKENMAEQTMIFYTNGLLKPGKKLIYSSFDIFLYNLSYFCTWSTGFSIWKKDFDNINFEDITLSRYFPQINILLAVSYKENFVINGEKYFNNQRIIKKGGYDLFKVFLEDFLVLMLGSYEKGVISLKTYKKIKRDLLLVFLSSNYLKSKLLRIENFGSRDIKKDVCSYYTKFEYYLMIFFIIFVPFRKIIISFLILLSESSVYNKLIRKI